MQIHVKIQSEGSGGQRPGENDSPKVVNTLQGCLQRSRFPTRFDDGGWPFVHARHAGAFAQ
jgi:hypothetical protein